MSYSVHRTRFRSGAGAALLSLALAGVASAVNTRELAPRFNATTLAGEKFSNKTVAGKVVLIQFWATWCGACRSDQPAVDAIRYQFADRGVIVLAVNIGEPRSRVSRYLGPLPRRSSNVVLADDTNLLALFPPRGLPYYVVIDRDGRIAAARTGAGGEQSLRSLLARVLPPEAPQVPAAPARVEEQPADEEPPVMRRPDVEPAPAVEMKLDLPGQPHTPELVVIKGSLIRLDCLGEMARMQVNDGRQTVALLVRRPDDVALSGGGTRDLQCGRQRVAVSVRYLPTLDREHGTVGEVRTIDFAGPR